eukprot:Gb_06569 [translate_table: standard]
MAEQSIVTFEASKVVEIFDTMDTFQVATLLEVMPCRRIIEWVVGRFDADGRIVRADDGRVFCALTLDAFHKMMGLPMVDLVTNPDAKPVYETGKLDEEHKNMVALLNRVFGEKEFAKMYHYMVYLVYQVDKTSRRVFPGFPYNCINKEEKGLPVQFWIHDSVKETLLGIGDWYFEKTYSYVILYGFDGAPHHLPKYLDDQIAMYEICWQIIAIHTKVSQRWKKAAFHSFPLRIGNFTVTNIGQAKAHAKEILTYDFEEIGARQGSITPPTNPEDSQHSESSESDQGINETWLYSNNEKSCTHGDERRETVQNPVNAKRRGEASRTCGPEQAQAGNSVPSRPGIAGVGGDDEENDPNKDRKWKRPYKEEAISTKSKRTPQNRSSTSSIDSLSKTRQATHLLSPSTPLEPTQLNTEKGTTNLELPEEEFPQGESVLNPWLVELMNLQQGSSEAGAFTMLDFSKQLASFALDFEKKTIKVKFTRPRASSAKTKVASTDVVVQETELDIGQLMAQEGVATDMVEKGLRFWKLSSRVEALINNTLACLEAYPKIIKESEEFMKNEFVKYNKFVGQESGDLYTKIMDINDLRDSLVLKKELHEEACDKFTAMKHNLFGKKASLEMVALKNFVPSPWQEGQLALKGDHMGMLQSEEIKFAQTLQNGETFDPSQLNQALKDRSKRRDVQDKLQRLKGLE